MRGRSYVKRFAVGAAAMLFLLLAFSFAAAERFVGLDMNGDLDCEYGDFDMGRTYLVGEVGTQVTVDLFFDEVPPFYGYGCTFCVAEGGNVGTATWVHSVAGGNQTFCSDTSLTVTVSEWITVGYPNYKCWAVNAYDFTFQDPVTTFPAKVGSLTFTVAAEGPILWIIDAGNTGVQTTQFSSIEFEQGMTCQNYASTEEASWGSVKQLFR